VHGAHLVLHGQEPQDWRGARPLLLLRARRAACGVRACGARRGVPQAPGCRCN
jgi:hypothetical protein